MEDPPLPKRRSRATERRSTNSSVNESTSKSQTILKSTFVVIGGGIAGVSCAQELGKLWAGEIILISASEAIKQSAGIMKITNHLDEFSIFERTVAQFHLDNPRIKIVLGRVAEIVPDQKIIILEDRREVRYETVCVCIGAVPKLLSSHPCFSSALYGLRDVDSAAILAQKLKSAKRVVIVGNGGIALELVHMLTFCHVDWIIRDENVGSVFFDASASEFLMPELAGRRGFHGKDADDANAATELESSLSSTQWTSTITPNSHVGVPVSEDGNTEKQPGYGIGPDWILLAKNLLPKLSAEPLGTGLQMHLMDEVVAIKPVGSECFRSVVDGSLVTLAVPLAASSSQDIYVLTKSDKVLPCDVIISATGVRCHTSIFENNFLLDNTPADGDDGKGGIFVDRYMRTSVPGVFAAGDCCACLPSVESMPALTELYRERSALGETNVSVRDLADEMSAAEVGLRHWFQMKLWTQCDEYYVVIEQARLMGMHAAHCMFADYQHKVSLEHAEDDDIFESVGSSTIFDIFTHVTRFFDYKVVLLGRFNAQGVQINEDGTICFLDAIFRDKSIQAQVQRFKLKQNANDAEVPVNNTATNTDCQAIQSAAELLNVADSGPAVDEVRQRRVEIWLRVSPGLEFVKIVVCDGRVIGAVLIGDTDLEEVIENLILNRFDVGNIGIGLLDPSIDLEDYFD